MELSDFIAETLPQVMRGVTKAAEEQRQSGRFGFINPMDGEKNDTFVSIPISEVTFDVAVTVERSNSSTKGAGGSLKVIELRGERETGAKHVGESRVRFAVPVCLPTTKLSR